MTKLPMSERPLIQDPDLAKAVEALLEPHNGKALERAQNAVRRVNGSGIEGLFQDHVAAYEKAIRAAVGKEASDA